jgi:serine/threonine-protein kinase RsbW
VRSPGGQVEVEDRPVVEVRIEASAAQISAVRVVAADLAARQDYDLDAVSDLRMAVDEACATLVPLAAPGTMLSCRFVVGADKIEVVVTVVTAEPAQVPQNTFGWRILSTLTDQVRAFTVDGDPTVGQRPQVGIKLCVRRDRVHG